MKLSRIKIYKILILLAIGVFILVPGTIHADSWIEKGATSVVNNILSNLSFALLTLTSSMVIVSGTFLSVSINITTHIGDFFNSIPALKDVWIVIRNLSSIFIIFILIYSSISTILGTNTSQTKALIGKIIMVGLLINFSLFFAKIAIDASNIVSLQFYRAIAPGTSEAYDVKKVFTDGGLSNIFMSSLKIPKIYSIKGVLAAGDVATSIGIATVGGMIMMITASISFFAAAIAFSIRTAILLFVMALSPLYFAGMIFPEVKKKSDEIMKLFTGQLIFMPAYLFLMYIALRVIRSPGFSAIFNQGSASHGGTDNGFGPIFIGVIIQYVIALVFIDAPLIAAIQMGAVGAKWAPNAKSVAGFFGQHTAGRLAKRAQEGFAKSGIATRNPNFAVWANKGFGQVSGGTFGGTKGGYDKRYKDYVKERTDYAKKLKTPKTQSQAYVSNEMRGYDNQTKGLQDQIEKIRNLRDIEATKASDPALTSEQRRAAILKVKDYNRQIEQLKGQTETRQKEREDKVKEITKKSENLRAAEFAQNLNESSIIPGTAAAREEAARTITNDLDKGKKEKLLDMLQEATKEDKPTASSTPSTTSPKT